MCLWGSAQKYEPQDLFNKEAFLMQDKINDGEAQINAILDITDNNLFQAMLLVCNDIQIKETHQSNR